MARTLPRTPRKTRRRVSWTLALLSTVALAGGPAVLSAQADDLHDKQKKAHHGVKSAQGDLEDSSKALVAATRSLQSAQGKLVVAQRKLAVTQGQLTAAEVLDNQMQLKLAGAVAALKTAQQELIDGIAEVKEQRADIGRLVATNYTYGDPRLMGLSAILQPSNVEDLTIQLNTVDNLMSRETNMLDELKATQALLEVQKVRVAKAKVAVAEQRQAAAVNLARKQTLEAAAARNRAEVASLVSARSAAAAHARALRAADARALRKAKKQEARIKKLILARARKHRGGGFAGNAGGFLLPPVANSYVTSPYGWRVHPIYGYWGLHDGDDFHAPCGAPLRASASGRVISEYYSDVWGNRLYLDVGNVNGKNMTLIYNHISSYRAHTGDRVKRGATVAYAGTTGWSTACHLHFTVMINGTAVDPQQYM